MSRRKERRQAERQARKSARPAGPGNRDTRSPSGRWASPCSPGCTGWPSCARTRTGRWPYTVFYEGDSETFFEYARALVNGRLYDNGIPFHPPGFAWVLAAVHTLAGAGPGTERVPYVAVKVMIALIGSLPVGLLYLLVTALPRPRRGARRRAALRLELRPLRDRRGAGDRGDVPDAF